MSIIQADGQLSTVVEMARVGLSGRKTNPFAVRINKTDFTTNAADVYENLDQRISTAPKKLIQEALKKLKARMKSAGTKKNIFVSTDFGRYEDVPFDLIDINIDNQRDPDWDHAAFIIENFDPRMVQVVNLIKLDNGRYSVPEGQHTCIDLKILYDAGLIAKDFKVPAKVVDESLMVPGNDLKGEAFGNYLFRTINYKGRKAPEAYYMHRSRTNGVRLYSSTLQEDVHAEEIQTILENNNMYVRPSVDARGQGAMPGMVTYIHGLYGIAEHDSGNFDIAKSDLDWALKIHDEYFSNEKGVDGGFILAFGRYVKLARTTSVKISSAHRTELIDFFRNKYGTPKSFHKDCKRRLKNFQRKHVLAESWSDSCLLSVLIMDFDKWCTKKDKSFPMLNDLNMNKFQGI